MTTKKSQTSSKYTITSLNMVFDASGFVKTFFDYIENIKADLNLQGKRLNDNSDLYGTRAFRNMNEAPLYNNVINITKNIKELEGNLENIQYAMAREAWAYRKKQLAEYVNYCNYKIKYYKEKKIASNNKTYKLKMKEKIAIRKEKKASAKKKITVATEKINKYSTVSIESAEYKYGGGTTL